MSRLSSITSTQRAAVPCRGPSASSRPHNATLSINVRAALQHLRPVQHADHTLRRGAGPCMANPDKFAEPLHEEDGSVIIEDDMDAMIEVLPPRIRDRVINHPHRAYLLEVILDVGRRPEARFLGDLGSEVLCEEEITWEDLEAAEEAVGEFGGDNRAGVEGTLHRISAMRSRKGKIVGLTCRVGRAVTGHVDMVSDILETNQSILFLGRPGVGKTTVIREMARVLSDDLKKRVVIVDTSNEIGGDGDVPHPAIGSARRMQVPDPSQQHRVMIEAVENHMPEIIIVDEVGTEAEALACRTIAERGVMLISTAHGQLLGNLIKNPTLSDLIGGIQSVTLGDDEARARGTQKTVLERAHSPTFPLLIEMRSRANWVTHWVEDSVDALLQGRTPIVQCRFRDPDSKKVVVSQSRYSAEDDLGSESDLSATVSSSHQSFDASVSSFSRSGSFEEAGNGASGGGGYGNNIVGGFEGDQYSWAQRLRNVPDKDALSEMAMMGYVQDGSSSAFQNYRSGSFTSGTGSGKRQRNKNRASATKSRSRNSRR